MWCALVGRMLESTPAVPERLRCFFTSTLNCLVLSTMYAWEEKWEFKKAQLLVLDVSKLDYLIN